MLVSKLRIGMRIDSVAIVSIVRIGALSRITMADGSERIEHKSDDINAVTIHLPMLAGPVHSKYINAPKNVRASSKDWRGESDGKRGERFAVKVNAYDLHRVNGR